jgi:hypothetical protein
MRLMSAVEVTVATARKQTLLTTFLEVAVAPFPDVPDAFQERTFAYRPEPDPLRKFVWAWSNSRP